MNWSDSSTHVLFNPRTPAGEVRDVEQRLRALRDLQGHLWFATSGSTAQVVGQVKWVALSKDALLASARAVNEHLSASASDIWIHVLPKFHVGGVGIYARAHLSRSRVVDGLNGDKWDPLHFHQVCTQESATLSALVPTQVYDLVQKGLRAPKSLRAIVIGGGALSENLFAEARALGWPLLPSYGLTECSSQVATATMGSNQLKLLSHIEARLSDDGKLQIRSPSLLTGFAVLSPEKDRWIDPKEDGWFVTEDVGQITETSEGRFLTIQGRSSNFVKIGGESVDLNRLQDVFEKLRVQLKPRCDLAIFAAPDERLGHAIRIATDALSGSDDERQAKAFVHAFNSQVLPFERARELHFVSKIPRSPLQKLLKAELLGMIFGKERT